MIKLRGIAQMIEAQKDTVHRELRPTGSLLPFVLA
jgi:hypothetical protein